MLAAAVPHHLNELMYSRLTTTQPNSSLADAGLFFDKKQNAIS
ncbi:Uncharacterised protein [Enterobacter hormaechei]|nr:Uncharacterised protein [Enterobacter hormaechei]